MSKISSRVYLLTCGRCIAMANSGMESLDAVHVRALRDVLPPKPSRVVIGEGARHEEMARGLGLWSMIEMSAAVGAASSPVFIRGQEKIYSPNGNQFLPSQCTSVQDLVPAFLAKVLALPDMSVVCTDVGLVAAAIGQKMDGQIQTASVYCLTVGHEQASILKLVAVGAEHFDGSQSGRSPLTVGFNG